MGERLAPSTALAWLISLSAIVPLLSAPQSVEAIAVQRNGQAAPLSPSATDIPQGYDAASSTLAQIDLRPTESLVLPEYVPQEDNFRFSNEDLTEAIQANRNQPDWTNSFTLTLSQLFGSQVCVGQDTQRCILTAAAQNWLSSQMDLMAQGLCDGIAAASLFLQEPESEPVLPWWQSLISELTPFSHEQVTVKDPVLQTFIANQALLQGLDEVYLPTQQIRESLTPSAILAQLIDTFRNDSKIPTLSGSIANKQVSW